MTTGSRIRYYYKENIEGVSFYMFGGLEIRREDELMHTFVENDRLDLLGYTYYNDPSAWWVIYEYNNIFYPFEYLVGRRLIIPIGSLRDFVVMK